VEVHHENRSKTMNSTTATRLQRTCLSAVAATIVTGVVLVGAPATATTDFGSGGPTARSTDTFDIAQYVAHRKTLWAQDRVDQPWLYR
jgi:hypothetical protein